MHTEVYTFAQYNSRLLLDPVTMGICPVMQQCVKLVYSCTVVQLGIVHNFIYFRVDYMIIYSRVDLF